MFCTVAVLGGDARFARVAERFAELGAPGGAMFDAVCSPLDALGDAELVVLPLPVRDGDNLFAPDCADKIGLAEIFGRIPKNAVVCGGLADEAVRSAASERGITVHDYLERPEFAVANAVPTAEGAIALAIDNTPANLASSDCLVTGYGRCARVLARKLRALDARVSCAARKKADLASIAADGCVPVNISSVNASFRSAVSRADVVFNTVPAKIFTRELLTELRSGALVIDLASKPGGVDMRAARELGINVIWALSLPGKVSPKSAGDAIFDTVMNIYSELRG